MAQKWQESHKLATDGQGEPNRAEKEGQKEIHRRTQMPGRETSLRLRSTADRDQGRKSPCYAELAQPSGTPGGL